MSKIVRIGLVGLGDHMIRAHVNHLLPMQDVLIVGCSDPNDAAYERLTQIVDGVPRYDTAVALAADSEVDAIMIGSPDWCHLPQLVAAVGMNKHVFCEKPMCSRAEDLELLKDTLEIAGTHGKIVSSCHPRRYDKPYTWVKHDLPVLKKEYGAPLELKLDFTYHRPSKTGLHGGSMLQDHMNHEYDYMNFLFGHSACRAHKLHDEEDRYHVAGTRDDGIMFSFGGTRRLDSHTYAESIDIRFERATLHIDTYNEGNSYIHEHERPHGAFVRIAPGATDYDQRFAAINRNFIDAIQGLAPDYLTPRDLLANSHMSVAFAKSSTVHCNI